MNFMDASCQNQQGFVGKYFTYPDTTGARIKEGGLRLAGQRKQSSSDNPLVTIITVCLNSAPTIERAIVSVINQTYRNIEYIVIDGGSADSTVDILLKYTPQIDYFLSEPDNGLYFAMNKGLELAKGKYILILNSDDWYEPQAVARLVAAVEYSGCNFVGALARYINANGTSHVLRSMPYDHSILLRMPLRHETLLISAELYDKIGPYCTNFPIIADYEYVVRLFEAGISYYEIKEPLLNFTTEGVSSTAKDRVDNEMRSLISKIFPFFSSDDLLRLTDHANIGPETFINLANANFQKYKLVRAVRSLLKDRKVHSGQRWKEARLETLVANKPLIYPKISVIVPFYNAENYIAKVLDNVLTQDLTEIEVICVDDCGNDHSSSIVESYAEHDQRVRLLHNVSNLGPGASRNRGIRAARGEYIFFLDADDAVLPGALRKLYAAAKSHGSLIVRGAFVAGQQVHGQDSGEAVKYAAGVIDQPLINTTLKQTPQLLNTTEGHWAALYDTDFIETILYPEDIRVGEDSQFLTRAYAEATKITVLPEVVYRYQANLKSAMNTLTTKKYFDGLIWRRRVWHLLRDQGLPEIGRSLLFDFWSEPYFDGLEKTLTDFEKRRYVEKLQAVFAEAGSNGAEYTKNASLRGRINALSARYTETVKTAKKNNHQFALRVATFTTQDHGGAGVGTQRRVEALRKKGIDAKIYCAFQKTNHDYVHKLPYAKPLAFDAGWNQAWDAWRDASVLTRSEHPQLKARELFSKPGTIVDFRDIVSVFDDADIIHLHWVSGIFDFDHVEVLTNKPVVWTLADMNPFTGGCHYSEGCKGYTEACCNCPLLGEDKNLARTAWQKKHHAYAKIRNLHIICPSQWLADCARESALFGDRPVHMIPNAFPINRITATNKLVARLRLGLPISKKLVVFGADSLSNRRKGGDLLADSIRYLKKSSKADNLEGVFFGASNLDLPIKAHNMGHVSDEAQLSLIYAAGDVYAFPSREDNAPLTVGEALLSGTPVVAFSVGNVRDLVKHKATGYIAENDDISDFATGLRWCLEHSGSSEQFRISFKCRQAAAAYHSPDLAASRHIQLYHELIEAAKCAKLYA